MVSMTTSSTRPSIPCSWKGKWCRKGTVTRIHKNNGTIITRYWRKSMADRMQHFRLWYYPSLMKVHIEMIWKLKHYKTIYFGLARYINWIFVKSKRYEINDDFSTCFDSKQLYCELIHIHMGAQLLQISAKKWVPHIHKPEHHMKHSLNLLYIKTNPQNNIPTKKFIFHKIWFPQIHVPMNNSTELKLII